MWRRIGPFAAWLWISNILTNVYESIDRTMLLYLARAELTEIHAMIGQCHSGRLIPQVLTGVAAMLGGTLMAYLTAHWESGEMDKVKRQLSWTMKLVSIGFTFVSLIALAAAPVLFDHVLQGKYSDGLAIMPLMFASCIWFSLMTVGQDWLWCRESGKWACVALGSGLLSNVTLNFLLIPSFGLWGAVWGTAISNLIALIVLLAISARFGWRPDAGVLATALFPLILLLPLSTAILVALVIAWGSLYYGWLFDVRERQELSQCMTSLLNRLQARPRT
jgi:O-antigen/teichoic acid export membrane protein